MKTLLKEHLKELKFSLRNWKRYKARVKKEEFLKNEDVQNMCFYEMFTAVQAAIDVGNDIISLKDLREPQTYKEIFEILKNSGVIDGRLCDRMKRLVGFRNVLAHFYWKIDLERAYRILKVGDKILERFAETVKRKLKV